MHTHTPHTHLPGFTNRFALTNCFPFYLYALFFCAAKTQRSSITSDLTEWKALTEQRHHHVLSHDSWFNTINPQLLPPLPWTLHFTFPAFPLGVQHSMGPSCMEASLSASRRCHGNLISHRHLWAASMRIYVVFTQRKSKVVIKNEGKKTHPSSYTHGRTARKMTTFHLEIQKLQWERGDVGAWCHFV